MTKSYANHIINLTAELLRKKQSVFYIITLCQTKDSKQLQTDFLQ